MIFEENKENEKGHFSAAFNKMAGHPLDEERFFAEAERAGYAEARVHRAGGTALYERSRLQNRINVRVDQWGYVQKFVFG